LIKDLLGAGSQLSLRAHRQREQSEQWVQICSLAQLLEAQPHHAINKRMQLLRQLLRAEPEMSVGQHHHHGQMLDLGMQLQKASGLGK
jgi:hypothetical protein